MKRIALVLIGLLFVCLLGFEIMYQRNTSMDTASLRTESNLQFVKLSVGTTAYQLHGPEEGPLLVLIHGFSIPHFVFDQMIDELSQTHQVLVYDVMGRGLSDKPDVAYNKELYVAQLDQLLSALQLRDRPTVLVGYSMGGAISAMYTKEHPTQIYANIHLAPGGMYVPENPFIFSVLPVFAQDRLMFSLLGSYFDKVQFPVSTMKKATIEQSQTTGFCSALTSTMRELSGGFQEDYTQVAQMEKPTLFIWGTADPIVSYDLSKEALQDYPNSKLILFENADHYIPFSHSKEIVKGIVSFLKNPEFFVP